MAWEELVDDDKAAWSVTCSWFVVKVRKFASDPELSSSSLLFLLLVCVV